MTDTAPNLPPGVTWPPPTYRYRLVVDDIESKCDWEYDARPMFELIDDKPGDVRAHLVYSDPPTEIELNAWTRGDRLRYC